MTNISAHSLCECVCVCVRWCSSTVKTSSTKQRQVGILIGLCMCACVRFDGSGCKKQQAQRPQTFPYKLIWKNSLIALLRLYVLNRLDLRLCVCVHDSLCDCRFSLFYLCLIRIFPIRELRQRSLCITTMCNERKGDRVTTVGAMACIALLFLRLKLISIKCYQKPSVK